MRPVCQHIIHVLLLAFSLSSVASPALPCVKSLGQESTVERAHGSHVVGHHDSAAHDDILTIDDCSCCDDCASMCPSSAGNPVTLASQNIVPLSRASSPTMILADLMHDAPPPHPLFRPPISIAD